MSTFLAARTAELRERNRTTSKFSYPSRIRVASPNYKYEQYQTELTEGRFQATEEDLVGLNIITSVDPLDISEFEHPAMRTWEQRQEESLRKVMKPGQIRKLHQTVKEIARNNYHDSILSEFPDLKANAERVMKIDPSASKRNSPMKIDAGTYYLKKEIRKLQQKLQFLKDANATMEEHIKVLVKARDTLSFEESAAKLKDVKLVEYNVRQK